MKKLLMSLLVTSTILATANAAFADFKVNNGRGNNFEYEVWTNNSNTEYTLKVWAKEDYPNGRASSYKFSSSREALDYFDCYYDNKSLPACPK